MNPDSETTPTSAEDDIDTILSQLSARPVPREEVRGRAFLRLQRDWMLSVRRRRRVRSLLVTGVAASIAAVAFVTLQPGMAPVNGRSPLPLASEVMRVSGDDVSLNGSDITAMAGVPSHLSTGDTVRTGRDSRIALSWQSSGSLRLNARTQVAFLSPDSVRLTYGTLYFDSKAADANGKSAATLVVETPHGTLRHLGTQFMAEVSPARIAISVREGAVRFDDLRHSLSLAAGDSVEIRTDDSIERESVSPSDDRWNWAAAIAPERELNGRSTLDLLTWVARETGRELHFHSSSARDLAASDRLVGLDRVGPLQALQFVPVISDLRYQVDGQTIEVSARVAAEQ